MRRLCLFLPVLLLAPLFAPSAAPPPQIFEKWTVDDVILREASSDFQVSPDGRFSLWVKATPDKDKNEHVSQVFRTDLASGREVQLTRSPEDCSSARWPPDGSHIAFLSSRPAPAKGKNDEKSKEETKTQIWLIDATGGEAWPVTEASRAVQRFGWSGPDALVFTAQEDAGRLET